MEKIYLGDSVYAQLVEGMICLTTDNGDGPSNTIYLESDTYAHLVMWVEKLRETNQSPV